MTKEIIIYSVGNALNRFCALIMFPIYAKTLSPDDFALQDVTMALALLLGSFIGLGVENGYARRFFDDESEGFKQDLATTWGVFSIGSIVVMALIAVTLSDLLTSRFIAESADPSLLMWCLAGVAFSLLKSQLLLDLRMRQKAFLFSLASIGSALLQLGLVVVLVWWLKLGSLGVVQAYAGAALGTTILALMLGGWIWRGRFSWHLLKGMLAFGFPLLPAALAVMGIESVNKFMLLHLSDASQTAIFGIAARIAGMLGIFMFGFQMGWSPIAFGAMRDPAKAVLLYEKASRWLTLVGGIAVAALAIYSHELILIFSKPFYLSAKGAIPFLALSALIWSFYHIVCVGYQYANKSHHQAVAMIIGLIVVIGLSYLLIPGYGASGAAATVAIGYSISLLYAWIASERYLKIPYQWGRLGAWMITLMVVCTASIIFPISLSMLASIAVKAPVALLTAFVGTILLLEKSEIHELVEKARSLSSWPRRRVI